MKRLIKILTLCIILILSACSLFACGGTTRNEGKTGLLYKKFGGDDFYTVYGYVDEGKGVTELDIGAAVPEGVVIGRIKANAFSGNDTLVSVIVPSTVETIDAAAFAGMRKLQKITLPFIGASATGDPSYGETPSEEDKAVDAARTFGYIFGTEQYNYGVAITQNYDGTNSNTYYLPITLKEVTLLPASDYSLPMYAFSGNTRLTKVSLGEKVVKIGDAAFKDCTVLDTVTIPAAVTEIGNEAFSGCTGLKNKNTETGKGFAFENGSALLKIGDEAFKGVSVSEFVIPSLVTSLGEGAFRESKITAIEIPASVTAISDYAFYSCKSLKTVKVAAVTAIGVYAFYDCDALTYYGNSAGTDTVDLGGVTELGAMSFAKIGKTLSIINAAGVSLDQAFFETDINI